MDGEFSHELSRALDWCVYRLESEPEPEDEAALRVILADCEMQIPPRAGDDPDTSAAGREP